MLKSILLYLDSAEHAQPVIQCGVTLARNADARVRGLTLLDTRAFDAAHQCESAVYLSLVESRHERTENTHDGARIALSQACLEARLNFDVRRISGNPLSILPAEARFHDLVIVSSHSSKHRPRDSGPMLSTGDLRALLERGVQPLMLVPPSARQLKRVLLAYDGSEASGRAIRSYLNLGILRDADHRLLAIGKTENEARVALAEMAEYCASHCPLFETGCVTGKTRRVLPPYATKWDADLVVLGFGRGQQWIQSLAGEASIDFARVLDCSLFVQT